MIGTAVMQRFKALSGGRFPLGTLVVNVTGCFLIGILMSRCSPSAANRVPTCDCCWWSAFWAATPRFRALPGRASRPSTKADLDWFRQHRVERHSGIPCGVVRSLGLTRVSMNQRIVVVGGGIVGFATAWRLTSDFRKRTSRCSRKNQPSAAIRAATTAAFSTRACTTNRDRQGAAGRVRHSPNGRVLPGSIRSLTTFAESGGCNR